MVQRDKWSFSQLIFFSRCHALSSPYQRLEQINYIVGFETSMIFVMSIIYLCISLCQHLEHPFLLHFSYCVLHLKQLIFPRRRNIRQQNEHQPSTTWVAFIRTKLRNLHVFRRLLALTPTPGINTKPVMSTTITPLLPSLRETKTNNSS